MERNFPWYLLKEYFDVKFNWILKKTTEEIIKTFNLEVKVYQSVAFVNSPLL